MRKIQKIKQCWSRVWADTQAYKIPFHEKFLFAAFSMIVAAFAIYFLKDMPATLFSADTTQVFSGSGIDGGAKIVKQNIGGLGIVESDSVIETVIWLIKWVLIISGILAVFAFIWAGMLYITSFVNEENNETAKKVMIYTSIGIIIIILSWTIVNFLTTFEF